MLAAFGERQDTAAFAANNVIDFKPIARIRDAFVYFPIALLSGIRKTCHRYSIYERFAMLFKMCESKAVAKGNSWSIQ